MKAKNPNHKRTPKPDDALAACRKAAKHGWGYASRRLKKLGK